MIEFIFTRVAEKQFLALEKDEQERILQKLKTLKLHPDIFSVLKPLVAFEDFVVPVSRLRIRSMRLILCQEKIDKFLVLKVKHRKDVYR
ncbi:MAG: hypothetical protein WC846_00155 [Candidatus Gracilibacteria bacterium]|jgi:mRNA-degrading endonuclease RelE of RelBE toxin-antitoxin system